MSSRRCNPLFPAKADTARAVTDRREYALDLSKEEIRAAEEIFPQMNFDENFELRLG